jgi:hypothetical protein
VGDLFAHFSHYRPSGALYVAGGSSSPASELTVAPRNWTRSWELNERRTGPDSRVTHRVVPSAPGGTL